MSPLSLASTVVSPHLSRLPSSGVAGVASLSLPRRRLALVPPSEQGAFDFTELEAPAARPRLRLVTGPDGTVQRFATRFAQVLVEVIGGDRALYQLMRWTTDEVYADLTERARVLSEAAGDRARIRRLRAQVRSVHLSQPDHASAEVSIHVRHGGRSRAIAARLDLIEERWRCSALLFG